MAKVLIYHFSLFCDPESPIDGFWGMSKDGLESLRISSAANSPAFTMEECKLNIEVKGNLSLR
jgi:hypothetical protein